jgi:hypothetical protein
METVIPAGTVLYKGFGNPGVGCSSILKDTRIFFVTLNPRLARTYSTTGTACKFISKRSLRLFNLNHKNVKLIFKHLKHDTQLGLKFVLGTNVRRGQQASVYKRVVNSRLPRRYKINPQNRGERLSVTNINTDVFQKLSTDFLIPQGYDGYYSSAKRSRFHGGIFPSEIMLCNANRVLVRPGVDRAPLLSRVSVIRELPQLFIQYCRKNRVLLKSFRNFFIPQLGGGMGVKLYLEARGKQAPLKVRNTTDFDFTFAVPKKVKDWKTRAYIMKQTMYNHVSGFVAWLNKTYTRTNARLVIHEFVPEIKLLPATGKYIYHVCQFRIQFPGQKEPMDFVDTTLAYVPGASRADIHPVYSRMYGLPIERLKRLYDSVAAVLAGSFIFPGVKPRNPIYGNRPEKGQKNVARLSALQNLAPKNVSIVRKFIRNIKKRNVHGAKINANKIIRGIQRKR